MDKHSSASPFFAVLRGECSYGALLRSKPYFSNEQFLIHVCVADTLVPKETQKNHPPAAQARLVLGLIVPKKRYPLAVDRNRIKRIARAHARQLASATDNAALLACSLLVRIKPRKKAGATPLTSADQNPHSAAFAQQLRSAMSSTWQHANCVTPI